MIEHLVIEDIDLPIEFVRSSRKTLALTITEDIKLSIKAPLRMSEREILRFVNQRRFWLYKQA